MVVAVDLLPLRAGNENGGIKPAIFTLLRALGQLDDALAFVFLTNSASHAQVSELARPLDILVCVREEHGSTISLDSEAGPTEFKLTRPPPDFLRTLEVDVLYCPFGDTTFHVPGLPTVALIADLLHNDMPWSLSESEIAHREAYIQKAIRVAAKLQCISWSALERMMKLYGVPYKALFYTYLPVHGRLDEFSRQFDNANTGDVGLTKPFFFYPANLWPHKNHETLLHAFASYSREAGREAWDLVLTFHKNPRAAELEILAQTLGVSKGVRFAGFVSERDLHLLWNSAGALVFPSLHEGFGIPLLEAMHYGVPIIAGSDFSLGEVLGDACYRIDPRNAESLTKGMLEISRTPKLRATLAERGRKRLQLFDLKGSARSLLAVFREVMGSEYDFPRKPSYSYEAPLLMTSTPASPERWKIQIEFHSAASRQRFSVYLNELLFSTFVPSSAIDRSLSFYCRPEGRTLSLRRASAAIANGAADGIPIRRIMAIDSAKREIVLYQNPGSVTNL